jgi:hypothetical protein
MTTKIDFIDAHNGGIKMFAGSSNLKGWGKTAESIAYTLKTVGLADSVMGSSSMDFASEEGFEDDDDALALWNDAIVIYNRELNDDRALDDWVYGVGGCGVPE